MNLLLDTHVLVWAESREDLLGPKTKALLMDSSNRLLVSPITTLELARLISLSRLILRKPLAEWLEEARIHLGFEDAPFHYRTAIHSYELPGHFHKDPADRILVATAREAEYTLVTADDLILGYPHVALYDART